MLGAGTALGLAQNNRIQCTLSARIAVKMASLKPIDFLLLAVCSIYHLCCLCCSNIPVNIPDRGEQALPGNSDPHHKSDPSPAVEILMERFTRFYKEVTPPAGTLTAARVSLQYKVSLQ